MTIKVVEIDGNVPTEDPDSQQHQRVFGPTT